MSRDRASEFVAILRELINFEGWTNSRVGQKRDSNDKKERILGCLGLPRSCDVVSDYDIVLITWFERKLIGVINCCNQCAWF